MPTTMDGSEDRVSMAVLAIAVMGPSGAYSVRNTAAPRLTGTEISSYAKQIKLLFSPKTEAYKSLGGIMTLGSVFPTYWSWEAFWHITAFFSIVLAIMNILPIPGLDGGHVLFLLVEVITRRKPSDKFMERATTVGFILILALLIFANGNDIYRFFIK